jgi:hypothetical protein
MSMDLLMTLNGSILRSISAEKGTFVFGNNTFNGSGISLWEFFDSKTLLTQIISFEFVFKGENEYGEIYETHISEHKTNGTLQYPVKISLVSEDNTVNSIKNYTFNHGNDTDNQHNPHLFIFNQNNGDFIILEATQYSYSIVINNNDYLNRILTAKNDMTNQPLYFVENTINVLPK